MNISLLRTCLLTSTMMAGTLAAGTAHSQTAATDQRGNAVAPVTSAVDRGAAAVTPSTTAAATPSDANTSEIIVTGSRISQPNLTSASPITVVNAAEIKLQGATRIEDVINSLPQAFAQQSSSVSNGSTGIATANLRNLGDQRTLVLVNGRRLMPGDPYGKSSAADLNVIPTALIKRVDVLTGGAGSVYGSDAVAGVVNFVLDTDYEGLSLDANYGIYNHDNRDTHLQGLERAKGYPAPGGLTTDGHQYDINLKIGAGTDDGRGHVVAYAGIRKIAAILQGDRDYSGCSLNNGATDYVCGGSATAFPANFSLGDAVKGGPPTRYTLDGSGNLIAGRSLFNANPLNYYQRPDTRYTAGFMAHYDVSDAFKPYAEFMFMDDRTVAQIAPSGDFSNTQTLNCNNPLLSAAEVGTFCRPTNLVFAKNPDGSTATNPDGTSKVRTFLNPDGTPYNQANVLVGRRGVESGGRQDDIRHTSYRFVVGARGDIAKGISYDAFGQYGSTVYNEIYRNEFSITKTGRALDVINQNGVPTCRSVVDGSDPACVPLNIFGNAAITPAALQYVTATGQRQGETTEQIVSGSLTFLGSEYGLKSPFADDGIAFNIGGEYREESLRLEVDQEFATGDLAGQGGPTLPVSGKYNVQEVFGELQVPLVSKRPFFYELSLNGGYRYSKYSTAGSVSSYKGEVVWAPIKDVRFRGSYNRAVRAPNVQELFQSQSVQIDGATDPCAGAAPSASQTQCVNLGVPAAKYGLIADNPAGQYNGLIGGNPLLKPEKADTFTVGVILQPSFLSGFTATADAFSIKVSDVIGIVGADTALAQCAKTGDPLLCGLIHRDANGTLWQTPQGYVVDTNLNVGTIKTRGIDASVSYRYSTNNYGNFAFSFTGTYVDEFTTNKAGANFNCAGFYGAQCGFPQSKWRGSTRLSWDLPDGLGLSARWRYFSPVTYEAASKQPDLAGAFSPQDARIKAFSYFDLTATARVADKLMLRLGVNNMFDRAPPTLSSVAAPISSYGNGNTYPGIYDGNGRYLFAGVTIDF